ncbi:MAG: PQQ-dependent sugar dehydrogenase [Pseudomonadales bacterium]
MRNLLATALLISIAATVQAVDYRLVTVADGLDHPWCLAFLPDGDLLITERTGTLRRIGADGKVGDAIAGVPDSYFAGQGGLLDVALDPEFARNGLIYLSYAWGNASANATRVYRARLAGSTLTDGQVLFTAQPAKDTPQHYGGRLAFMADGTLLLTTGDGFDYRELAQRRDTTLGKVIRINRDGSIPADNPFADAPAPGNAVYSYGHRNPQGLTVDPATGTVYEHEHGPRGGDEVNVIRPGANYGWPAITWGMDYTGAHVSPYTEWPGMEQPSHFWVPSIAPSGLALYRGDLFPEWEGDLFVGALVDREVRRLDLVDGEVPGEVQGEEALFSELGERIRDVRLGPDGLLYLVTDGPGGRIVRVERP